MKSTKECIIAGFVGGLAPYLANVARYLVGQTNSEITLAAPGPIGYLLYGLGVLCFALLGSAVVYFYDEKMAMKAFALGASAPAVIALMVKEPVAKPIAFIEGNRAQEVAQWQDWSIPLISTAHAQSPPSLAPLPNRILEIQPKGDLKSLNVKVLDATGTQIQTVDVNRMDFRQIQLKPDARAVVFSTAAGKTPPKPLPTQAGQAYYYEVTAGSPQKKYSFFSGVTGDVDISQSLSVQLVDRLVLNQGAGGWAYIGKRVNGVWQSRCLNFSGNTPSAGEYLVVAITTVLDRTGVGAKRIGRLDVGQKVKLFEFQEDGTSLPANTISDNGMYYGRVVVL